MTTPAQPMHKLEEVGTTRSWDYTEATLISPGRFTVRTPTSTASFCKTFFASFPALQGMDWSNVAVRGGAVVDILLGRPPTDIDLFLYGLPDDAAFVRRAEALIAHLLQAERRSVEERNAAVKKAEAEAAQEAMKHRGYYSGSYDAYHAPPAQINIQGYRHGPVITLWVGCVSVPVQIVLTSYASMEEVVHGADLAVCGAAFNGEEVLVSAEGRWSLENLAIRVQDGQFPQAVRLQKYFNKGFDVVLEGMDVDKLPKGYLRLGLKEAFETPCLTVSYSALFKCKISVDGFLNVGKPTPKEGRPAGEEGAEVEEAAPAEQEGMGGYDAGASLAAAASGGRMVLSGRPDARAVLYKNMELLVRAAQQPEDLSPPDFAVFAEGDFVGGLLQPWPHLTSRQVENTLEGVRHMAFVPATGLLNFGIFMQFIQAKPLKALLAGLADGPDTVPGMNAACFKAVLEAVEEQKAACNAVLPRLQAHFEGKLPPVMTSEETFKHKLVTKSEVFYGRYAKTPVQLPSPGAVGGSAEGPGA